ncbi:hypothetical protein KPH14_011376 [Odynerus spinipes]|uniref:Uncharacterized protein n=1 Tax=Odynerus spinipes TaxID=1348599 RepID=A0AAD9RJE6_9HYME|nr:hypothetical protein KPH14_011376 [Odynerus spinipes]
MMKQQQKEQQELLQAQLAEMESRRAAQTYVRMRKQQEKQQKRKISKETRAIEQANLKLSEKQMEMKRSINNKVFKEWKRQKDIKLKEQRMRNNAYQQYANYLYHQQRQQLGLVDFVQGIDNKFNSWLNQLDWVLHEKYLRERRYLVRSFYCQPAYYGNAADIVYSKRQ